MSTSEYVDLAIRRYRQIVPKPVTNYLDFPAREVLAWLENDVCATVEDFVGNAEFQEWASWPVRSLAPGAGTPERELLEATVSAIRRSANCLGDFVKLKTLRRELGILRPSRSTDESRSASSIDRLPEEEAASRTAEDLAIELSQLKTLAAQGPRELVNVDDYFDPQPERVQGRGKEYFQRGELIVAVNSELQPVGDFVVQCMLRRIELIRSILDSVRTKCLRAIRESGHEYRRQCESESAAWRAVESHVTDLRARWATGRESRNRNACIILVQAYAAFAPSPDLAWLNLSAEVVQSGVGMLRHRLTNYRRAEMAERIAAALSVLRGLVGEGADPRALIQTAVAKGGLVIVHHPPSVYWECQPIEANWKGIPWKFLNALARKAHLSASVTEHDLYSDTVSHSAMSTNWGRLKKLLPASLRKLVVLGEVRGAYRLDLDASRIDIFSRRNPSGRDSGLVRTLHTPQRRE